MTLSIIAAIGQNRELGKDNTLLWHIPEDIKRFRKLTTNHAVIMGRKTYESIGKSLPDRTNIVITRNPNFTALGCSMAHSLDEAIKIAKQKGETSEVFLIGGGEIYKQAIGLADKLYLTRVEGTFNADTFFPDYSAFAKILHEETHANNHYTYTFLELTR